MIFGPLPYVVTKNMMSIKEVVRRLRFDNKYVFRWTEVVFNLSGMDSYNPARLWIYRVREDGTLAADICWYIDDDRPTGSTAWEGGKDASKTFCTLIFSRFARCWKEMIVNNSKSE